MDFSDTSRLWIAKLPSGKIVQLKKAQDVVGFSKDTGWLLVNSEPGKDTGPSSLIRWIPADTRFEWVRPFQAIAENFRTRLTEISNERLQQYLSRAGRQVDARQERMARVRDRLNKGYEIYHADAPNKIVHKFEANTPAEAQRYYADYIARYESDVDYDLRLRRATGIMESFDQPYPIKWEKSEADESVDALARLPDGSNLSIMFNQDLDDEGQGIYSVEFWRNNSQEVTGAGDAQRVFATVLAAIAQFIEKRKPEQLYFSANKDVEPGQKAGTRSNLYTSLVQRYASALGYEADISDFAGSTTYKLYRLYEQSSVEENFADGKVKGKSRPGRVKRAGASCKGSVTDLRAKARKYGGEKGKMYHWCANMKSGKKKNK